MMMVWSNDDDDKMMAVIIVGARVIASEDEHYHFGLLVAWKSHYYDSHRLYFMCMVSFAIVDPCSAIAVASAVAARSVWL